MGVALATPIAGRRHPHQARIHGVLDIALEDAVFNQHIAGADVAFIIDIERAPAVGDGAIIKHGHAFGSHTLADPTTERAGALAVEITFQSMTNRLVQQNAGPSGPKHHGHLTSWRRAGFQVDQRGFHRLIDVLRDQRLIKISQPKAPTATSRAHFTPHLAADALFGNHRHRQAHQWAYIGRQRAVGTRHQHHVVFARHARHDLRDARVFGTGYFLYPPKNFDLGRVLKRGKRFQAGEKETPKSYFFSSY